MIEKFPWVTPYNYAENEPVGSIDLWGLQKVSINDIRNSQGQITSRNVTVSVSLNILNVSSRDDSAINSYKISSSSLGSRAKRSFSTSFNHRVVDGKSGRMTENEVPVNISFELSTKNNAKINSTDFVTAFVDQINGKKHTEGRSLFNDNIAIVEADQLNSGGNAVELILHELGHSLGLDFSYVGGDEHTKDGKGLMGAKMNKQFGIDSDVLKDLFIGLGALGSAEQEVKYFNTSTRLLDFIMSNTTKNGYDEDKAKKRGL